MAYIALDGKGIDRFCSDVSFETYSRLSLSRVRLSRITAYLEVKIWPLFNLDI